MALLETLWFQLDTKRLPIFIGQDLRVPDIWVPYLKEQVLLVTETAVADSCLEPWKVFLDSLNIPQVDVCVLPSGEATKALSYAEKLWDILIEKQHTRHTTIIGLGGGMITDLCGFVAANYLRGVQYIPVPTSLLAQIDAAIGGKCGVNHQWGKNLIGTIHQPAAIFLDTTLLKTLPDKYFREGLSEAIKYGIAFDRYFFVWLEQHKEAILERNPEAIFTLLKWSCQCKTRVVSEDEFDTRQRLLLNFGHTMGHALEALSQYAYTHGEAVALGMLFATQLSYQRGLIDEALIARLRSLLQTFRLPQTLPRTASLESLAPYLHRDKKRGLSTAPGQTPMEALENLRWVLLTELGQCHLALDVTVKELENACQSLYEP